MPVFVRAGLLLLLVHDAAQGLQVVWRQDHRLQVLVALLHHRGLVKVLHQGVAALDARVADLADLGLAVVGAYLVGVELLPALVVELEVEILDGFGGSEVYERVADVALVLGG